MIVQFLRRIKSDFIHQREFLLRDWLYGFNDQRAVDVVPVQIISITAAPERF